MSATNPPDVREEGHEVTTLENHRLSTKRRIILFALVLVLSNVISTGVTSVGIKDSLRSNGNLIPRSVCSEMPRVGEVLYEKNDTEEILQMCISHCLNTTL